MNIKSSLKYLCILFVVILITSWSTIEAIAETSELSWTKLSGSSNEIIENGRKVLDGTGILTLPELSEGDFAIQLDLFTKAAGYGVKFHLRADSPGDGIVFSYEGVATWSRFRTNLQPGDKTFYDATTVSNTVAEEGEWWTLKLQLWDGRIMAKAWRSSDPEPDPADSSGYDISKMPNTKWVFDFPLPYGETGPVFMEQMCKVRNLKMIPLDKTEYLETSVDHRRKRFGPPQEEWIIETNIELTPEQIIISSDLTDLYFDRSRCSIGLAEMRTERFDVESFPDLKIINEKGEEYRQRYAADGNLKLMPSTDDRWIVLDGACTPRTKEGIPLPYSFLFEYRIHRQSGLIAVRAVPRIKWGQTYKIRQLVMVGNLNDSPEQQIDDYQRIHGSEFFGKGNRCLPHDSRADTIISGRRNIIAAWGNGKYAFQVMPMSFKYCSIDKELSKNKKAYRHLAIGTREGHRFIDMVFVNQKEGNEIEITAGDAAYESTFSFLPWRRWRPRIELAASSRVWADPLIWSVSYQQERLQRMAKMGVTLHGLGYPPQGMAADETYIVRVGRQARESHYYGIKDMVSWVEGGRWPRERALEQGWITKDEMRHAARLQRDKLHAGFLGPEQEISDQFCMNDPIWRNMTVDRINLPVFEKFQSSAVYWDWTWPLYNCDNHAHGDDGISFTPLGHIEMIDRFREQTSRLPERPMVMGCTYDAHTTCVSLIDMYNPGESGKGWWVPNRAELNLVYSSLLYGTQCIYYTLTGGMSHDTVRTYELALARCSTVFLGDEYWDPNPHDPPGSPGGYTEEEIAMWIKYMTPLVIFGINDSEYRHPFDEDYSRFCRSNDGVTTVLYFKNGQVFVAVVKEDENVLKGNVTLNCKNLGLSSDKILMYDVINSTAETHRLKSDELTLPEIDLSRGPRFFVLRDMPLEPIVIWNSPGTWNAELQKDSLVFTGVPNTKLEAYLWCGKKGAPRVTSGGTLKSYDRRSKLALISTEADGNADALIKLKW